MRTSLICQPERNVNLFFKSTWAIKEKENADRGEARPKPEPHHVIHCTINYPVRAAL